MIRGMQHQSTSLYQSTHQIFPGKIGCGMRFKRSKRRTEDTYRSPEAAERRKLRAAYRKEFSHVEVDREGNKRRRWAQAPGLKSWLQGLAEQAAAEQAAA